MASGILGAGRRGSRQSAATVLLVRNGVVHDARVLRTAAVAAKRGPVLVIGAAAHSAPAAPLEALQERASCG